MKFSEIIENNVFVYFDFFKFFEENLLGVYIQHTKDSVLVFDDCAQAFGDIRHGKMTGETVDFTDFSLVEGMNTTDKTYGKVA